MRPGKRRHQVTFQRLPQPGDLNYQDEFGEINRTWQNFWTTWASIEPLRGQELVAAQAINNDVTHKVNCRYRADKILLPNMRMFYAGRGFALTVLRNIEERNEEWEIEASEGLRDG